MSGGLASINVKFFADLASFSTSLQKANRSMQKMGKQMTSVGKNLSVGLTAPLVAFAAVSLKTWDEQEKAIAQVEAGLKSTGNQVGYTSEQLQKMASELQKNSLFGDEEILKGATSQLLTFTNIAGEQFERTQVAALDLATRLDGDLKSASIQLGKALNDPVANLSALSRSGIQFSEDQKAMINSLVATNQLAEAQTIILNELENQYGGSAEAASKAGLGPMKQLSNILGDLTEDFGKIIGEALLPFIAKIKEWVLAFKALEPGTKKIITVVGLLAAAIGPVLAGLGFLMTTVVPGLVTVFAALSAPILAVVAALAAIAYVVYDNWAEISNYFVDLYNESLAFKIIVEGTILVFKNMWTTVKAVGRLIVDTFKALGTVIKAALTLDYDLLKKGISDFTDSLKNNFEQTSNEIGGNIQTALENAGLRAKIVVPEKNIDTTGIQKAVTTAVSGGGGGAANRPKATGIETTAAGVVDFTTIPENLKTSTELASGYLSQFQDNLSAFQLAAVEVGSAVGATFADLGNRLVDSLGLADEGFQGFVKNILGTMVNLIAGLLAQSIATSIAGATASGAATGPAAVFTTPAFIATAIGGVLSAFAAIPKFATGGIVGGTSYHGDKLLALVNSGEAIFNTDQQKALYNAVGVGGSQNLNITVDGTIRGSDIKLSMARQNKIDNRNS